MAGLGLPPALHACVKKIARLTPRGWWAAGWARTGWARAASCIACLSKKNRSADADGRGWRAGLEGWLGIACLSKKNRSAGAEGGLAGLGQPGLGLHPALSCLSKKNRSADAEGRAGWLD
jgi:hypothetical protein